MPAILVEQFRIFRFGPLPGSENMDRAAFAKLGLTKDGLEQMPLGVAIWAKLSEAAEAKLEKGERLDAQDGRSGDRLWLVEMISPFANAQNKLSEAMLLDLLQGPFKATPFSLHRTDPQTGKRERVDMSAHVQPGVVQ